MNKSKTSNNANPICFVISSPSGAGKTTLVSHILKTDSSVLKTISHTTRKPRANEVDGVDYHFVDTGTFETMVAQDEFIEHALVYDQRYGTSKKAIQDIFAKGKDAVLVIENQGAQNVAKLFDNVVFVLILPPSIQELEKRLQKRNAEENPELQKRLNLAKDEIKDLLWFDYAIINEDLEKATRQLQNIIESTRLTLSFQKKSIQTHFDL